MRKHTVRADIIRPLLAATLTLALTLTLGCEEKSDGTFKTVKIGNQVWMAENLNIDIQGSKCYENKSENCKKYGRLYDYKTAVKACPKGWHLSSDKEWQTLVNFAGGREIAGRKLKSKSNWDNNGNGTDDYGFSALPGGYGSISGFSYVGIGGIWWSPSESDNYFYHNMGSPYEYMGSDLEPANWDTFDSETALFSVRCVQDYDETATEQAKADNTTKPSDEKLLKHIPKGYRFEEEVRGDLNGDGADDYLISIRSETANDSLGIMIFFRDGSDYKIAFENRRCFYTEFQGPSFKINRGNLNISFSGNGTCDIHEYNYVFKYRNSEFELIGYDANDVDCGGWNEKHEREGGSSSKKSINFLTKKRMTKVNKEKEVWDNITTKGPILLRKIDIGNFNIDDYITK